MQGIGETEDGSEHPSPARPSWVNNEPTIARKLGQYERNFPLFQIREPGPNSLSFIGFVVPAFAFLGSKAWDFRFHSPRSRGGMVLRATILILLITVLT